MKRISPYQRLVEIAQQFAWKVAYPERKVMCSYQKDRLHEGWRLDGLAQRVQAADQLGYDVKLEVKDGDLRVLYVKRPPEAPYQFRP